jgi:hypothetical protein
MSIFLPIQAWAFLPMNVIAMLTFYPPKMVTNEPVVDFISNGRSPENWWPFHKKSPVDQFCRKLSPAPGDGNRWILGEPNTGCGAA